MKDEYLTPLAEMLAFNYMYVVSASFDMPEEATGNKNSNCSNPAAKQGNCGTNPGGGKPSFNKPQGCKKK